MTISTTSRVDENSTSHEFDNARAMWEILVPTVRPNTDGKRFFTTRYHRVWDEKVRAIAGGLTILTPAKGTWTSDTGIIFRERMIPVRIIAKSHEIEMIIRMTAEYYSQEVVLCYMVSNDVRMYNSGIVNKS